MNTPQMPAPEDVAPQARKLMRQVKKVALATLDRENGGPFISMTGVATEIDGTPILLLSELARHTQNILKDARVSLLFDSATTHANPLTQSRVSLTGRVMPTDDEHAQTRFLVRQPKAFYSEFSDFKFYRLAVREAHFVGGFGVALPIPADILLFSGDVVSELKGAESSILAHMNEDHTEAVQLYATKLLKAKPGDWRLVGIDPEGIDLATKTTRLRLDFSNPVTAVGQVQEALVELAKKARAAKSDGA